MDAFAQVALMAKAKVVFESDNTFLSFPALSPLTYPTERLRFSNPADVTASDLSDIAEFANIVNRIPRGVLAPIEDEEHLWDVYAEVLETATVALDVPVSADAQARYDEAIGFLYVTTPEGLRHDSDALTSYKSLRDAHITAQEEYKNRKLSAESSDDPAVRTQWIQDEPGLRETIDRRLDEWQSAGGKAEVEEAQQVEEAHAARTPALIWADWKKSFIEDIDLSTDTNQIRYALTGFSPYDVFDRGVWPTFNLAKAEMLRLSSEAPTELMALLGIGDADSDIESVSFEYRSVGLTRSWLRPSLFRSSFWRLGSDGGELSDGGQPPKGRCPSYVTGLVFARNITVRRSGQASPVSAEPASLVGLNASELRRLRKVLSSGKTSIGVGGTAVARGDKASRDSLGKRPVTSRASVQGIQPRLAPGRRPVFAPAFVREGLARRSDVGKGRGLAHLGSQAFAEARGVGEPQTQAVAKEDQRGARIRRLPLGMDAVGTSESASIAASSAAPLPDVTILAFICRWLPRCPDPNPSLAWR